MNQDFQLFPCEPNDKEYLFMHVVLECGIEFTRVSGVSSKFVVNMQLFCLSCAS